MIIVELNGGLGNQLFQYAAARRLALRRGVPLKLDLDAFRRNPQRSYRLGHFQITAQIATAEERARFVGAGPFSRRWRRLLERITPYRHRRILRERHFHFDPALLEAGSEVMLIGYWQSPRYFADAEALIRHEFGVRNQPDQQNAAFLQQITTVESVSLHVRRGDYVNDALVNRLHGLCSPEYYAAAVEHIAAVVARPHFFIFSDEPAWATENLRLGHPTSVIAHNGPERDYEDLRLMSHCKHHIIANSSFSWWGAWLGTHPGKLVIAPARWFAGRDVDTGDLIPESWFRL